MYKNQLQELAQRSCFNLPSYVCVREGPDHAPRFKASVNFNGEIFQGPSNCTTLRQAEHAAAEVALSSLSSRTPARSLAARVLDETGVYKNLLQETTHRAGLKLPLYTTVRSGPGHQPVFTSTVELAGMCFAGEQAKTKKQAEKNAAMAAWSALKQMPSLESLSLQRDAGEDGAGGGGGGGEEQEQVVRVLSNFRPKVQNKPLWQREQYPQQRKRRVAVGYNERTSSASPLRSPRFHHQWRSSDPLADFPLLLPSFRAPSIPTVPKASSTFPLPLTSSVSSQKRSSSSLFNPSSSSISCLIGRSPLVRSPEIQTLLKGKEEEGVRDKVKESCSTVFTRPFRPTSSFNFPSEVAPMVTSPANPVPRVMSTGGFHGRGIAPAVQIRSVIPVCAAPPIRPPPPPPPPPVPSAAAQSREIEEEAEFSVTTSKLHKLQL